MTQNEELSRLIRQAERASQALEKLNCPQELRQALLVTLLLKSDSTTHSPNPSVPKANLKVDEFFDRFLAEGKGEYVLAAAYYLHAVEGRQEFTATDVQTVLRQARVGDLAANTTDMMNKLGLRKKWFIETGMEGKQKLWALSRDGEKSARNRMEGKEDD